MFLEGVVGGIVVGVVGVGEEEGGERETVMRKKPPALDDTAAKRSPQRVTLPCRTLSHSHPQWSLFDALLPFPSSNPTSTFHESKVLSGVCESWVTMSRVKGG